ILIFKIKMSLQSYKQISDWLLFFALLLSMTFISCNQQKDNTDNNLVFRYNESANIQTLDPAFARNQAIIWPCEQLINGLILLNDSLSPKPDIAKGWTISKDGLVYTFTSCDDGYFHKHANFGTDSRRVVVAEDFVYSFDRWLSEQLAS